MIRKETIVLALGVTSSCIFSSISQYALYWCLCVIGYAKITWTKRGMISTKNLIEKKENKLLVYIVTANYLA